MQNFGDFPSLVIVKRWQTIGRLIFETIWQLIFETIGQLIFDSNR